MSASLNAAPDSQGRERPQLARVMKAYSILVVWAFANAAHFPGAA